MSLKYLRRKNIQNFIRNKVIMWIFIILGAMQKSDVFYVIGITIGVARLVILIILSNIELKVHDVFWQEKLREINEREED